mgnify:CR=1 FL=1
MITTLLVLFLLRAVSPISLEVTPRMQHAPVAGTGRIRILVTIPKNDQNRVGCVEVDGPVYRSSCFEIDGQRHAYRQEWVYVDLPSGAYRAVAVLRQANGKQIQVKTDFCIIGDDNTGC